MSKKTISNKLVALSVLIIIIAAGIMLDVLGLVKWLDRLSNVPVIGPMVATEQNIDEEEAVSPLEMENLSLQKQILELQKELTDTLTENNKLQLELVELEAMITELTAYKEAQESKQNSINELVEIYENMKPAIAAEIFMTLSDDLIIDILQQIPREQATKILSSMKPEVAGRLTKKLSIN
ncbi:MAG: hypothetical protein SCK28_03105 [Bacillota bacterium]|nr:hypothetical protein [Bacillota bacterium]